MTMPIRVNTDLNNQAKMFQDSADEIRSIYSKIRDESAYWETANGKSKDLDEFNKRFDIVASMLPNFAGALEGEAEVLENIADAYEQARQRAVSRAGGISGGFTGMLFGGSAKMIVKNAVSALFGAAMGAVGLGGVYEAGKELYNTGKQIYNTGKQVYNTGKQIYDATQKISQKYYDYTQSGKNFTEALKEEFVSELKEKYLAAPLAERADNLIPGSGKYVKNIIKVKDSQGSDCYHIDYKYDGDGLVDGSRTMKINQVGEVFDRVGSEEGRTVGAMDENGNLPTWEERAVPYLKTQKNVTDEPAYHRYQFTDVVTEQALRKKIANSDLLSDEKKLELSSKLDEYYGEKNRALFGDGGGLQFGKTAEQKAFDQPGGGSEYRLPLSVKDMKDLGFIKEIFDY